MNKISAFFKKANTIQKLIFGAVSVILVAVMIFFVLLSTNTSPVQSKSEEIIFEVKEGDHLQSIVQRLETEGIIKDAKFAKIQAKLKGTDGFIVGQFKVNKNWDSTKILSYFTVQKNVVKDEKMITFAENLWAKQIAAKLDENLDVSKEELLALWNDEEFLRDCIEKYEFLDENILNNEYRVKLEGYLYPETYSFNIHSTAEEITYRFLDHFDSQYQMIKKELKNSPFDSVHELITFASVVQYESKSKEDMQMIAQVFLNRMNKGMNLGSSVTVCYAIYDYTDWKDCESRVDIESPYNTYLHTGLPIGPILNPGMDAIDAVLHPKANDYLYFIADINNVRGEGAGKVYYSKTFDEHLKRQQELQLSW